MFSTGERGLAMIATPEEVVLESTAAGTFVVDVDLDRCRELRSREDEVGSCLNEGAKAGVLTQWQRPELRQSTFVGEPAST